MGVSLVVLISGCSDVRTWRWDTNQQEMRLFPLDVKPAKISTLSKDTTGTSATDQEDNSDSPEVSDKKNITGGN